MKQIIFLTLLIFSLTSCFHHDTDKDNIYNAKPPVEKIPDNSLPGL